MNFNQYLNGFKDNDLSITNFDTNFISNFAFTIVHKNKKNIVESLQKNNIEVRPLIAGDMSKKPMWFEKYGHQSLPNCELVNEYGFYIPNHQDLTENQINIILNIINNEC